MITDARRSTAPAIVRPAIGVPGRGPGSDPRDARLVRAVAAARSSVWEWEAATDLFRLSIGLDALHGLPRGGISALSSMLATIHPDDRGTVRAAIERALGGADDGALSVEFRVVHAREGVRWLLMTGQAEVSLHASASSMAGVTQDMTERRVLSDRIARTATHDELTDLPNRKGLRAHLAQADLSGERSAWAVLMVNLDEFRTVNDVLGHVAGDTVLRSVTARLGASVRGTVGSVARVAGDQFAILQAGLEQPRDAEILARNVVAELQRPHVVGDQTVRVNASVGIAVIDADCIGVEQALAEADIALHDARQRGGRFSTFEPGMQSRAVSRLQLEADLRQALGNGELELHFQPMMDLSTHDIAAFEALLRWRHPVRGLVFPGTFIDLAEETGLIEEIGAWALSTACAEAVRWPSSIRVAVNLSTRQFSGGDLPRLVRQTLDDTGLPPQRLELEITESLLLRDTEETLATLRCLRKLGVSIAMDDFGTGYSSLSYFAKFPFDRMKIDRSFVSAANGRQGAAIIRAMVELCRGLGIAVTAEGIETARQLKRVRNLGCTQGQGYLLGRPGPASEVQSLIDRWGSSRAGT